MVLYLHSRFIQAAKIFPYIFLISLMLLIGFVCRYVHFVLQKDIKCLTVLNCYAGSILVSAYIFQWKLYIISKRHMTKTSTLEYRFLAILESAIQH